MALAAVHYEIHLRRGDRWVIEAVLHDREAALEMGRGMADRGEAEGVRVVKECASAVDDAASALTLLEVVRQRPKVPRRRLSPAPQPAAAAPELPPAERQLQVRPRPPAASPPWWRTAAGLSGIGAAACVLLVGVLTLLI